VTVSGALLCCTPLEVVEVTLPSELPKLSVPVPSQVRVYWPEG
jgi:hypothetical protein